jgi:hypothetical protein
MPDQVNPRLTNAQLQQASKKLEIGWVGLIFGDVTEKPGNIAAAAIFFAFLLLAILLFVVPDSATSPKNEALTLFGSIITGALGFLFGRGRR